MDNLWLKVKVWTKLGIFFVIFVYLLIFVAENSGQPVKFWYLPRREWDTSLLYFTFFTFLAGVVCTVLARTIYRTAWQFRELRRRTEQERRERELRELQAKAAMLQTRAPESPAQAPPAEPRGFDVVPAPDEPPPTS